MNVGAAREEDSPLRVLVHGITGRMGREVLAALHSAPDVEPVGGVRRSSQQPIPLPGGSGLVPVFYSVSEAIDACAPHVMVDFSNAEAARAAVWTAAAREVHLVIGTTGLGSADMEGLRKIALQHEIGAVVAPNFALGAVLLGYLAQTVARHFDYAEIVETHHEAKKDAPSGTALALARSLASGRTSPFQRPTPEKETLPGTRGGDSDGVTIHSMRMPGRLAHHEIILGAQGQTLTLRHDTVNRECYMPGVLAAVRKVGNYAGQVVGLEKVLGLEA